MLCDRGSSNNTSNGDAVDEDSELEIVFEGDVDCGESHDEQDLETEDDGEDDDDYDASIYDTNDGEEEDEEGDVGTSNCHDAPFWYSYEDTDQISEILNSYTETLKLDEEIKSCVRAPPPFIGRVQRIQVDNDLFTTLDQVSIYKRELLPLGMALPAIRDVWLLTSWDAEEGLPLRFFEISKDSLIEFWQSKAIGEHSNLYCRPVYHTKHGWDFGVSHDDTPITYASTLHSTDQLFAPYLPKRPIEVEEEDDPLV